VVEIAVSGFPKDSITRRESQHAIQRSFVRTCELRKSPHRLWSALLDVIGYSQLPDCADSSTQGRSRDHPSQLFGFAQRHFEPSHRNEPWPVWLESLAPILRPNTMTVNEFATS
jgi:hypothetical protein